MPVSSRNLVIFDLGGVLADLGDPALDMRLDSSDEQFWNLWLASESVRAFENGKLAEQEFLGLFSRELGLTESPESFRQRLLQWRLKIYPGVVEAISALRGDCDTALLSNTNSIHWNMVRGQDSFEQLFDHIFLSYEIGHSKPDRAAFEHVLDRVDQSPSAIRFLDDSEANVEAARDFGITALQVDGRDGLACLDT